MAKAGIHQLVARTRIELPAEDNVRVAARAIFRHCHVQRELIDALQLAVEQLHATRYQPGLVRALVNLHVVGAANMFTAQRKPEWIR